MKAILVHKTDAMRSPGGGEVQLSETAVALDRLGVVTEVLAVEELLKREADPEGADVYHFFGTVAEFLPAIKRLSQKGSPCLVSTIAWYDWSAYWHDSDRLPGRLRAATRFAIRAALPWLPSWRKRIYRTASLLLPNSETEAAQLRRYFGIADGKIRVIPNGVDPRFASPSNETDETGSTAEQWKTLWGETLRGESDQKAFDPSKAVLCVGRFEPRKNQLGLIRAWREKAYPLLFVGEPAPGHEAYLRKCRQALPEGARIVGAIDHDDPRLAELYARCACLVVPSRFETPGLVALEAALTGTPLVLTERGCTREYFGELADYIPPDDLQAIRRAIRRAMARGRRPELARHVLSRFTWTQAAEATLAAYESVVVGYRPGKII